MNNTNVNVETTTMEVATTTTTTTTKKVSYRQDFIKVCSLLIDNKDLVTGTLGIEVEDFNKFEEYFNTQINKTKTVVKGEYKPTEKGMLILEVLISDDTKYFTGKEIAESSQGTLKANGVSGSIRGLVANGLVEATNDSPKKYKITQQGIDLLG